jgi:hypothetical protein
METIDLERGTSEDPATRGVERTRRALGAWGAVAIAGLPLILLAFLEQLGVADAPSWPTIAVTPLALHRVLVSGGSRTATVADSISEGLSQPGGTVLS